MKEKHGLALLEDI